MKITIKKGQSGVLWIAEDTLGPWTSINFSENYDLWVVLFLVQALKHFKAALLPSMTQCILSKVKVINLDNTLISNLHMYGMRTFYRVLKCNCSNFDYNLLPI
jgi:hypothetical protein